jgi:protein-disulfide isomerase
MLNRTCFILIVAAVFGVTIYPAIAQTKPVLLPSEETVNGFMRSWFGYEEGTTWKILKIQTSPFGVAEADVILAAKDEQQRVIRFLITPDSSQAVPIGDTMPFGLKPFVAAQRLLDAGAKGPSKGPATAPVTIVEFSDFECPHCKDAQPVIEKLLAAHPEVKFVFQNFPLTMHDWARKAASYADCVGRSARPDAFWKFVGDVFEAQNQITASNADEKLTTIADGAGAKGSEIAKCSALPATDGLVQKSVDLGTSAGVTSTPTFFVNGRKLGNITGVRDDVITAILNFHAKEDK